MGPSTRERVKVYKNVVKRGEWTSSNFFFSSFGIETVIVAIMPTGTARADHRHRAIAGFNERTAKRAAKHAAKQEEYEQFWTAAKVEATRWINLSSRWKATRDWTLFAFCPTRNNGIIGNPDIPGIPEIL